MQQISPIAESMACEFAYCSTTDIIDLSPQDIQLKEIEKGSCFKELKSLIKCYLGDLQLEGGVWLSKKAVKVEGKWDICESL